MKAADRLAAPALASKAAAPPPKPGVRRDRWFRTGQTLILPVVIQV